MWIFVRISFHNAKYLSFWFVELWISLAESDSSTWHVPHATTSQCAHIKDTEEPAIHLTTLYIHLEIIGYIDIKQVDLRARMVIPTQSYYFRTINHDTQWIQFICVYIHSLFFGLVGLRTSQNDEMIWYTRIYHMLNCKLDGGGCATQFGVTIFAVTSLLQTAFFPHGNDPCGNCNFWQISCIWKSF